MAHILIIDDDEQIRTVLRQLLEANHHEVTELADGTEAAEQCQQERPDLVITDLLMPEQEGLATIMALRRVVPQVKIIAMSGGGTYLDTDFLPVAQRLGADRTIAKPFGRQDILSLVQELLG
jgi:CheY-like chemotaxis protein